MNLRPATVHDAPALAEVQARSWQATYRGLVPQDYLDGLDPAQREPGWRRMLTDDRPPAGTIVLGTDDGDVVGFVRVDVDAAGVGVVTMLYLLEPYRGRGGGRRLLSAAVDRLAAAGVVEAVLWVLDTNVRARGFYERLGWAADGTTTVDDSRGFPMLEVRYHRFLSTVEP